MPWHRIRRHLSCWSLLLLVLLLFGCGSHAKSAASGSFDELAIGRSQRLTLRGASGTEKALVTTPPGSFPTAPVWSPDGSRIAYVQSIPFTGQTSADWGGDVYIVPAAGGTPQLVRKHTQPGDEVFGLAWTADGKALFAGVHTTTFTNGAYGGATQQLERLDIAAGTSAVAVPNGVFPSISRDGTKLAYVTQDPATGAGGVWVSTIDGQGAHQVIAFGEQFPVILSPRISPAGDAIAFSAPNQGQPAIPTAAGTPAGKNLPANAFKRLLAALWPAPAPAGAHGLPMDIWRASVADGSVRQLTHVGEDDPNVTWSRDGSEIVFIATGGLYSVSADGSGLRKVGQGEFNGNIDAEWGTVTP